MKVVVYTVILNGYDYLRNHVDLPYDFIAYIDDNRSIVPADTNWVIRDIPDEIKDLPMFDQLNYLKHMPHKLFPDYDLSIYEDGKISVNKNIQKLVDLDYKDNRLLTNEHPDRQCLYDEIDILRKLHFEKKEICDALEQKYLQEGYPRNNGLVDTCMMIRRHNDPYVSELMEEITSLLNEYHVSRHELVFNYVRWKQHKEVTTVPEPHFTSPYFYQFAHYKRHYTY